MLEASDLSVGVMPLVAQQQLEAISRQTKEALAAVKARGVKLGNPNGAAALRRAGKGAWRRWAPRDGSRPPRFHQVLSRKGRHSDRQGHMRFPWCVWCGAFIGSLIKGHFRWEACEDPRELRRQIFGVILMGVGAVVAVGCSIGQGLSAFPMLAWSAPVTLAAILAGAALGLRHLIAGFQPAE